MNPLVRVPAWPSGFVTTTLRAPTVPAGVVAVSEVLETKLTPAAFAPPMETVAPETNPLPVIVTAVPPNSVPALATMLVTVGAE